MGGPEGGQNPGIEQLLADQQRRDLAKSIQGSFQQFGATAGQPTAMPGPLGGGAANPLGQYMQPQLPQQQTGGPAGALFGGGGGITEQELAGILQRLGLT